MARKKKTPIGDLPPAEGVEQILAHPSVVWFPVKHFSPVCAFHVRRLIQQLRPVGVLVEGPQDATSLIPWLIDPDTRPPVTILSTYVDERNVFGLNGVLSPSPTMPARFRAWWPLTVYCPEYVALKTGHEVGAALEFIDVPLTGTIPHSHARRQEASVTVGDDHLSASAYFQALAAKQRRRNFEDFWGAPVPVRT